MSAKLKVAVISLVLFALVVVGLYFFGAYTNRKLRDITLTSLSEIMEQQAYSFTSTLNAEKGLLEAVAASIAFADINNVPHLSETLNTIARSTSFENLSFINAEGEAITSTGRTFNASHRDYFKAAMSGKTVVSEPLESMIRDETVIAIAAPIRKHNKIIGVLAGGYNIKKLNSMFGESFGGAGYAFITDNEGTIIAHTDSAYMFSKRGGVLDVLSKAKYIQGGDYDRIRKDLYGDRSGYFEIEFNGQRRISWYKTISINGWNIFSAVPSSVINSQANDITFATGVLTVILVALVSAFGLYSYTTQKRYANRLFNIAYIDDVTGGGTLARFKTLGGQFIEANRDKNVVITCTDINDFGMINDMHGYQDGDDVLRLFYRAILSVLHEGDICARGGNDVFFTLTTAGEDVQADIFARGETLKANFRNALLKSGKNYKVTYCTSVYQIQPEDSDISKIIEKALISMREAKKVRSEREFFYDEKIRTDIVKNKNIENTMHDALKNGELLLYIQPKFNMKTNALHGGEALIRWLLPNGRMMMPDEFIPVFERTEFIIDVDLFMFESLCALQKRWLFEGRRIVPISVNQSKLLVEQPGYVEALRGIVEKYKIPPRLIELELTETLVYQNFESLRGMIGELKHIGFNIAIDDFGSGYSSLGMLKEIYADVIKIDRSFLLKAEGNARGFAVLSNMVNLARELNMEVVCEGVETREQANLLLSLSCELGQGFLYSRAVPKAEFERKL